MKPTSATGDRWSAYRRWNAALAEVIYGPSAEGRPAYLDLEDDILAAAADRAGADGDPRDALVGAVRATLGPFGVHNLIFEGHRRGLQGWRADSGAPPPIIALLAVQCLAAEDMAADAEVSGNNYYERLMPVLGANAIHKTRVTAAYRSTALTFWAALNNWLEDLQGSRGLPTAYSFTHQYIGLPMSQALIRGVERDQLRGFFSELGLPPRARLSAPDMRALLEHWLQQKHAPISHALRTLWASPAARERIVEVACALLATWEPREPTTTQIGSNYRGAAPVPRARDVRVSARLVSFPIPSLEIGLIGSGVLDPPRLSLQATTAEGGETTTSLPAEELPGERWAIEDPASLDHEALLSTYLRLHDQADTRYERRPRRLIPFTRDDLLQSFVEAERLTLGADGMLLCTEQLADATERALEQVARPGYRRRPAPFAGNLSWTLFSDVQILAPLPQHDPATEKKWDDDLNVLQPLAAGQVLIEGGLQLPGRVRRWSSLAPPELRIVTGHAERLHVVIRQTRALVGDPQPDLEQPLNGPTALLDLSYLGLSDGDYEVCVDAGPAAGKLPLLGQVLLRLRSANSPNPLAAPPGTPSPSALQEHEHLSTSVPSTTTTTARPLARLVPAWWTGRQTEQSSASPSEDGRVRLVVVGQPTASCFGNGKHHLDYPTFYGHAGSGSIDGTCRGCGLVKRSPASYRPKKNLAGKSLRDTPALRISSVPEVQHPPAVNPDTVLDALSHDVRGPLSGLERLAAQLEDSALYARDLERNLLALGHLRLRPSPEDSARTYWEITPSALQQTSANTFVLVGARSWDLLNALRASATTLGATIEQQPQPAAPTRLLLHASEATATELLKNLAAAGYEVLLSRDTPEQLAAAAPVMSSLRADLPSRVAASARSVQRWTSTVARWRPATTFSAPGAYQLQAAGRTSYCLRDINDVETGRMRPGDVAVIKHGIAELEHAPLIGYEPADQSLYVPLGADLPAPYARAAAACSGLVPQVDRRQGLLLYPNVPPAIAAQLHDLLSR